MAFADDLSRFGPGSSERVTRDEALAYCTRLTAGHYENFSVVTRLTPREHRPAFRSIYAFCRWSDDLGDEVGDPLRSLELLDWWRGELRDLYEGRARHPVMIALGETVERYGIPIGPFEALISAFEQDQSVTEYQSYEQLLDYCTRSADPVGHLVLHVAGAFSPENARLSDATCTALQLANFWQDVARDLAIGRIYLPREDRDRFGVAEADLRALRFTPAFAALMKFEVERTRAPLRRGPGAGAADAAGDGRRRRPVLPRRPGHPRPDRGPGVRRADGPAGPEPLDQGPAAGARGGRDDDGPAPRRARRRVAVGRCRGPRRGITTVPPRSESAP